MIAQCPGERSRMCPFICHYPSDQRFPGLPVRSELRHGYVSERVSVVHLPAPPPAPSDQRFPGLPVRSELRDGYVSERTSVGPLAPPPPAPSDQHHLPPPPPALHEGSRAFSPLSPLLSDLISSRLICRGLPSRTIVPIGTRLPEQASARKHG